MDLTSAIAANPAIAALRTLPLGLPQPWLVAGCLAQSLWNRQAGRPATHGIADYDIAYFDPADLSAETEAAHEARLRAATGLLLDVKNQARVHLWYGARFGRAIAPHASVPAAIATYPSTATTIGLNLLSGEWHTAHGLGDLLAGHIRANRRLATWDVFEAKARRWAGIWPHLVVLPWAEGVD